jgi:hypothetical protein
MTARPTHQLRNVLTTLSLSTLIFRYCLRYFSRLHRTNFSQIPQDLSLSCDPVGFAIFTTRIHWRRRSGKLHANRTPLQSGERR